MPVRTKAECLEIEAAARNAVGRKYSCTPTRRTVRLGAQGPCHEFDIYAQDVVIGGVSTSPLKTGGGSSNTGGRDRACSELLWLLLWPGVERRIHVLTDRSMADWVVRCFRGAEFPNSITIYHYDCSRDDLVEVGLLNSGLKISSDISSA